MEATAPALEPTPEPRPDVSVSVVNYRSVEPLMGLLGSVLERRGGPLGLELFVVDNASGDPVAERVPAAHPDAHLILNRENLGFAGANNQAIARSRGRYVFVTNPDVVILPGSLERMVEYMDAHPDVGALAARLEYPDGTLQLSCRRFPTLASFLVRGIPGLPERVRAATAPYRRYLMLDWEHDDTREVDWALGSCLLVRRETIEEVGGFDDGYFMYYEDIDWCYRMRRAGWKVVYFPEARMVHAYRRQSASALPNKLTYHHIASALRFFRKFLRERGLATLL